MLPPPDALVPPVAGPEVPEEAVPEELPADEAGVVTGADWATGLLAAVVVVAVVDLVLLVDAATLATPVVGTVSGGAPLVSADVEAPPPHAASAALTASTAKMALTRLIGADGG